MVLKIHRAISKKWLADIPATAIGEIHLAGYSQPIDNTPDY
jgi:uncharacterized protein (UPF0276 family)